MNPKNKALCIIYNMAAKYRTPIFKLLDSKFDIDWYYGEQVGDVKGIDDSELKHVTRFNRWQYKELFWQHGVLKLIFSDKYDTYIVSGEMFVLSTWVINIIKKLFFPHKKIYFWTHGWYGREGFLKKWLKRLYFGMADGTFTYGEFAKEKAIEQGNSGDKIWPIHNSLDHSRHLEIRKTISSNDLYKDHFGNDFPTIIFIGRLTKVKKLDILLEALRILKEQDKHYNLVLVGDGEERNNLEYKSKQLGLGTWFYGVCYDEETNSELIHNADLCVSPGNVGLTAIHTMTFGTPVITHDSFENQMPEFECIKQGVTGDFFEYGSVESLANSIDGWFTTHLTDRSVIRENCYNEIDKNWTPEYQLNVVTRVLGENRK